MYLQAKQVKKKAGYMWNISNFEIQISFIINFIIIFVVLYLQSSWNRELNPNSEHLYLPIINMLLYDDTINY